MSGRGGGRLNGARRLLRLARELYEGGSVSSRGIRMKYGVSRAQARLDVRALESELPTERLGSRRVKAATGCQIVIRIKSEYL